MLDLARLAQLLQNLQVFLNDPVGDAKVILGALDLDGSGYIQMTEWTAAFEPAIEEMERMRTNDFFRDAENSAEVRAVRFDLHVVVKRTFEGCFGGGCACICPRACQCACAWMCVYGCC
jgi:hypothetical protein